MDNKMFKVLAVDDNIKNIQVIGSVLKEANFVFGFAFDGQQALDLLNESNDYDLILLDVNMPKMDGFETCVKIRENKKLNHIPVIFLTALSDTENIIKGFEAGGQDYITKPFNNEELLARVKTHIELKHSKELLRNANAQLERKVEERTKQLVATNNELRKANDELQKLDDTKADFMKLISHEINTPLNGIIGFTGILKEELVDHEFYKMLEYLEISAKRLEKFAQVSLLVTELRTKEKALVCKEIEIGTFLEEIVYLFSQSIKEKDVRIVLNRKESKIYGEARLIKMCIERLLHNAVRYSLPDGVVTINVNICTNFVCLEFKDFGAGFPDKILKNPYKLFTIGDEHRDEDKGISLTLIKMIMDAHNGEIKIKNNETVGATVLLKFPNKGYL